MALVTSRNEDGDKYEKKIVHLHEQKQWLCACSTSSFSSPEPRILCLRMTRGSGKLYAEEHVP